MAEDSSNKRKKRDENNKRKSNEIHDTEIEEKQKLKKKDKHGKFEKDGKRKYVRKTPALNKKDIKLVENAVIKVLQNMGELKKVEKSLDRKINTFGEGTSRSKPKDNSDDDFQRPSLKASNEKGIKHEEDEIIRSRSSPKCLYTTIQNMNDIQKEKIRQIGFGSILEMKFFENQMKLGYYLVNNFDECSSTLNLKNGSIKITKETVHEVLCVLMKGLKIKYVERSNPIDPVTISWRKQFNN
ncbi:uncharacterized protein [Rutidosis leptorrhynchoides]|uniref:uncharacterized protein n=1 Tax=Rutidosis leptorrhynchoides TaxID=125765 RepID=UPI003A98E6D6